VIEFHLYHRYWRTPRLYFFIDYFYLHIFIIIAADEHMMI